MRIILFSVLGAHRWERIQHDFNISKAKMRKWESHTLHSANRFNIKECHHRKILAKGMWPEYSVYCLLFTNRIWFSISLPFSIFFFFSLSLLHQSTLDIRTHRAQSNIPLLADRRGWECLMRFSLTRNFRTARTKIECGKWKKNNNDSDGFQWYVRFQSGSVENNKKYAHSPIFPPDKKSKC